MDLDALTNDLKSWLDNHLHEDWLGTALTIVIVLVITAIVAHLVTMFLRRILKSKKGPLPALSIFLNLGRIVVWCIGICVILSSCFNIDVGGAVTALGIGGIAISLGFQDTLSNLIGGLQIIMTGLVEPGDRVKIGTHEGIVHDVTWRHTTIVTVRAERVVIPNSLINSEAMVKLPPDTDVRIDITIMPGTRKLKDVIYIMEKEVAEAVSNVAVIVKKPKIEVIGSTERGYKGLLTFAIGTGVKKGTVIDTALKAISDSAIRSKSTGPKNQTFTEKINNKANHHIRELGDKIHDGFEDHEGHEDNEGNESRKGYKGHAKNDKSEKHPKKHESAIKREIEKIEEAHEEHREMREEHKTAREEHSEAREEHKESREEPRAASEEPRAACEEQKEASEEHKAPSAPTTTDEKPKEEQ